MSIYFHCFAFGDLIIAPLPASFAFIFIMSGLHNNSFWLYSRFEKKAICFKKRSKKEPPHMREDSLCLCCCYFVVFLLIHVPSRSSHAPRNARIFPNTFVLSAVFAAFTMLPAVVVVVVLVTLVAVVVFLLFPLLFFLLLLLLFLFLLFFVLLFFLLYS